MVKNYFKTAWRTIKQHKVYSTINIVGLTIGLCTCMLIATVVLDDLSYDRQWSKGDQLYRITSINKMGNDLYNRSNYSFVGLGPALKNNFPEVEAAAGISNRKERLKFREPDANGVEIDLLEADTAFWQMLDMRITAGKPRSFVEGYDGNLVVTERFKKRFFPAEDPVGKIIHDVPMYSDKMKSYLITGIIEDIPSNTVFRSDVIMLNKPRGEELHKKEYGSLSERYILFKPGTDVPTFTDKANKWYQGFVTTENPRQYAFQPVKDIYLHSDFADHQKIKGNYKNVYILSGVAFLLLGIACINFINLSTARALQRIKETGIRKILGASRLQLIRQFLSESVLFFFIASVAAIAIYRLSLPLLTHFVAHDFSRTFTSTLYLFVAGYGVILFISIVTGIYPALALSSFKPAVTIKGELSKTNTGGGNMIRKGLVVMQFVISVVVLIALIVVQQQVAFLKTKDIGYDAANLLSIGKVSWDGKGGAFKNELLKHPGVAGASIASWIPSQGTGSMRKEIDDPVNPDQRLNVWYISADVDFAKIMGMKLADGRFLSSGYGADAVSEDSLMQMERDQYTKAASGRSSVITSYTAKVLQAESLQTPIKEALTSPVGIVKDFNNESLREPLKPTIIVGERDPNYGGMLIRVVPGQEKEVMAAVNTLWREFYQHKLLELSWVDDMLAAQYKEEARLEKLFSFFSGISLFLAALGVLGLIIHATALRKKEIGIRKVLGASVASIVRLFSGDFLMLVLIAVLIASPIAWYLMDKWLLDFAYRIHISIWFFVMAGVIAVVISFVTIGFQTMKAAMANPVKSLRTE